MKSASDWSVEQAGTDAPAESAEGAQSSDLFHGDLFGDELIDIYNAAVGQGSGSEGPPSGQGEHHNHSVTGCYADPTVSHQLIVFPFVLRDPKLAWTANCRYGKQL